MELTAGTYAELCHIAECLMHGIDDAEEIEYDLNNSPLLLTSSHARAVASLIEQRLN